MRRFKQKLSLIITFLFLITLVPRLGIRLQAETTGNAAADTYAVLVGNFVKDQGLGYDDWKPDNLKTMMKRTAKGIYELSLDFTKAGNYEYKAAFNGQWDNPKAIGDNGNNKALNVTAPGKVSFRVDYNAGKVYDSINDPGEFKAAPTPATLVGTLAQTGGKDWTPSDAAYDLDYMGNGYYKKTFHLNAGKYEYKVAYDHDWGKGEVSNNISFTLDSAADVTFLANHGLNLCTDSVNDPSVATTVSLIGEVRNSSNDNWNEKATGYEFAKLGDTGKFIYGAFVPQGKYLYKASLNYTWDNPIPAGMTNNTLDLTTLSDNDLVTLKDASGNAVKGKYVVFICDTIGKTLIDSITNPDEVNEALGLAAPKVTSPVINPNGTITFNYVNNNAKSVYLAGNITDWQNGMLAMNKVDDKNGIWSISLRVGDNAQDILYKFIVDGNWITDPLNPNTASDGNSKLSFPGFTGRKVVLAGTIQAAAGETTWNPGSEKTKLTYDGNGQYHITIPNVPAGNYEYKIAMGSWDPENYGANGKSYGDNMKLTVSAAQDVTFWYSDDSHYTVNSIDYKKLDVSLKGTGIPEGTKLIDSNLTNIYNTKIKLQKGSYNDIKAVVGTKEYAYGNINITEDSKDVTFNYAPSIEMVFSDAASQKIDLGSLYFDSRSTDYKTPYGAVPTGSTVTFNLKAKANDLTVAKLVLSTNAGTKIFDMSKNGSFSDGSDKWSVSQKFDTVEMDKYYFLVSNGSDVKAYSDDDGYFGPGAASDISNVKTYDLNVYDKNFKTPDWMKNAVIYQIFPDRFFDGDNTNDYAQKLARGSVAYETPNNWYIPPEDPTVEFKTDKDGNILKDASGKPILNPDYKGFVGDGEWSNDIYGGDLKGVQAKLDYLQALGINVLYFNPISQSISNHRYDTTDYQQVDPLLGYMDDFVNLANEAHKRGMHVILDGVFNHVSDDSIYFDRYNKYVAKGKPIGAYQYWSRVYDLMNNSKLTQADAEKKVTSDLAAQGITDLHYKDWFKIDNVKVDAGKPTEHYQYEGWWGYDSMPVIQALNGSEYQVKSWADEIIDGPNANSRLWLENGSNGWRLDVANEVSDETWRHFRGAVKQEGDNVIIGEIWDDASKYLLGDMYDSVMNYRFRNAVLYFVKGTTDDNKTATSAVDAMNQLEKMREQYPKEAFEAMMNLVDSHDTQRAISAMDGYQKSVKAIANDPTAEAYSKMKLIPLIQMTYPGAPTIYYGDEAGMPGADDPDNRRGMIWGEGNQELVEWYAKLTNIRNAYPVLRTGDVLPVKVDQANANDVMAYLRNDADNHALIAVNRNVNSITGMQLNTSTIPNGTVLTNALNSSEKYVVTNGTVTVNVPAQSGVILVASYKTVTVNNSKLKDAYDPSYKVADKVRVTGIKLNQSSLSLKVGATSVLKAEIAPSNATLTNITWTSSNENVAKVDEKGKVKVLNAGNVEITATTLDGSFKAVCEITASALTNSTDDINTALNNPDVPKVVVDASKDSKIDKSIFETAKQNKKDITFNAGDVTWTFSGSDITNPMDLDLSLKTPGQQLKDEIAAKIKEATGKDEKVFVFSFNHDGPLPGNATIRLFIGKEWANKTVTLRRYFADKNTYETVLGQDQVKVDADGYAVFTINHCSDYFVTEATLPKTGGMPMSDVVYFGFGISILGVLLLRRRS